MYPRFIQEEVSLRLHDVEEAFPSVHDAPQHKRALYAQNEAARIKEERFTFDANTRLPNTLYTKKYLEEAIDAQLANESLDSFDHVAHISIDLNGLKAVNDLNGGKHSVGDRYLRAVADWLWNSETLQELKQEGATVSIGRTGGDEFSITIIEQPNADVTWNKKWHNVRVGLMVELDRLDVSELIPKEKIQELLPDAPDDFVFKASAGLGMATLEEALNETQQNDKNAIDPHDTADRMSNKLMGAVLDMSDDMMGKHKAFHKDMLKHGNEHDRALSRLLTRTEEQRILETEYAELRKEYEELKRRS